MNLNKNIQQDWKRFTELVESVLPQNELGMEIQMRMDTLADEIWRRHEEERARLARAQKERSKA